MVKIFCLLWYLIKGGSGLIIIVSGIDTEVMKTPLKLTILKYNHEITYSFNVQKFTKVYFKSSTPRASLNPLQNIPKYLYLTQSSCHYSDKITPEAFAGKEEAGRTTWDKSNQKKQVNTNKLSQISCMKHDHNYNNISPEKGRGWAEKAFGWPRGASEWAAYSWVAETELPVCLQGTGGEAALRHNWCQTLLNGEHTLLESMEKSQCSIHC